VESYCDRQTGKVTLSGFTGFDYCYRIWIAPSGTYMLFADNEINRPHNLVILDIDISDALFISLKAQITLPLVGLATEMDPHDIMFHPELPIILGRRAFTTFLRDFLECMRANSYS
jgi:hypothetical protein